ncbi:MAG: hypothetical protein EBQ96_03355 [Proteobacteria bacterium]|nr:hypothetical protein [Pseudomonadota bacterium]
MGAHDYLRFILALLAVLALMGLLAFGLRRYGMGGGALPGVKRRLNVLETRPLDHRHKLLLVKCDEREHLILLGPDCQTVIDANITAKAES